MKKLIVTLVIVAIMATASIVAAQCRYIYVNNQPVWVCDYNPQPYNPPPQPNYNNHQVPRLNTNGIDIGNALMQGEMIRQMRRQ